MNTVTKESISSDFGQLDVNLKKDSKLDKAIQAKLLLAQSELKKVGNLKK